MPIEHITSFSGLNMRMEGSFGTASTTGFLNLAVHKDSPTGPAGIRRLSESNMISYNFGVYATGSSNIAVGMRYSLIGGRFNTGQTYTSAFFTLRTGPRELDATQYAIIGTLKCQPSSYADFYGGTCLFPYDNVDPGVDSFRFGYRIRQRNSQTNTIPLITICSCTTSPPTAIGSTSIDKGHDCYLEFEWTRTGATVGSQYYGVLKIYVDDAVINTITNPTYDPRFCGWYKECYTTQTQVGSTLTYVDDFEVYDMYFQRVKSAADTRPGPLTSVVCAVPATDASVEFTRPSGYNSNASVASGPMRADNINTLIAPYDPLRFLSATAIGQQDMYNIDGTAIKSRVSNIAAVVARSWARNTGSGLRGHTSHLAAGGVEATPGFATILQANETNYGYRTSWTPPISVNPATGQRWIPADLDTVTIGAKLDT